MKQNSVHFFVAITALSLFILCHFFLEEEKKRERKSKGDIKMHGVPFHQSNVGKNLRIVFPLSESLEIRDFVIEKQSLKVNVF